MNIQSIKIVKRNESINNPVDYVGNVFPLGSRTYGYCWYGASRTLISEWLESLPMVRGGAVMKHDLVVRKVPLAEQHSYVAENPVFLYISEDYLNTKVVGNRDLLAVGSMDKTSILKHYLPDAKGLYLYSASHSMNGDTLLELLNADFFADGYKNRITSVESFEEMKDRIEDYTQYISCPLVRIKLAYREVSSARLYFEVVDKNGLVTEIADRDLDYYQIKQVLNLMEVEVENSTDEDLFPKETQYFTKTLAMSANLKEFSETTEKLNAAVAKKQGAAW